MPYNPEPFQPFNPYDRQISSELMKANENFRRLQPLLDLPIPEIVNLSIPYSQFYIQNSAPDNPNLYDSWYNIYDNTLQYYDGVKWVNVDWTDWVKNDFWYRLGKLRINSGKLEISNNGKDWYQVFPSIGRVVEVIADDLNPDDDYKIVYLTVGQSLVVNNKSFVRSAMITPSNWEAQFNIRDNFLFSSDIAPTTKYLCFFPSDISGFINVNYDRVIIYGDFNYTLPYYNFKYVPLSKTAFSYFNTYGKCSLYLYDYMDYETDYEMDYDNISYSLMFCISEYYDYMDNAGDTFMFNYSYNPTGYFFGHLRINGERISPDYTFIHFLIRRLS
jgi:hypothetical protein